MSSTPYAEQCGRQWDSLTTSSGRSAHTCRRDAAHEGEHVCSCGAQLWDEQEHELIDEVPC